MTGLARSLPKRSFMGVLLGVAGSTRLETLDAESKAPTALGRRWVTGHAGRHPVGPRQGESALLVVAGQAKL